MDAVLARVWHVHGGDGEGGELARHKLEDAVVVGRDLLVVLQPGDLWYGVARNIAGEIEGLKGGWDRGRTNDNKYELHWCL